MYKGWVIADLLLLSDRIRKYIHSRDVDLVWFNHSRDGDILWTLDTYRENEINVFTGRK